MKSANPRGNNPSALSGTTLPTQKKAEPQRHTPSLEK